MLVFFRNFPVPSLLEIKSGNKILGTVLFFFFWALNPFNIIYKNKKTKVKLSIQYRIQICVTDLCSSIIRLMPGKNKHNWWTTVATVKGEAPGQHHNPRSFIVTSLDCEPCCRSEGMDFLSWNIYSSGSKSKIVG